MNQEAHSNFQKAQKEMDDVVASLKNDLPPDRWEQFQRVQQLWTQYRDGVAEFRTVPYQGGTIASMIYSGEAERLTRERTDDLKSDLEYMQKGYDL